MPDLKFNGTIRKIPYIERFWYQLLFRPCFPKWNLTIFTTNCFNFN